MKSVRTGLKDEAVCQLLLPYLRDHKVTMVELLKQCRLAVTVENERQFKLKQRGGLGSKVGKVETGSEKLDELVGLVNAMKTEVAQLRERVENRKESNGNGKVPHYMGCQSCRSEGRADRCRHCWKCGADGHVSRNCRSGNRNGLPSETGGQ